MLDEAVHATGVSLGRIGEHEEAAHQKRNWVRLTYTCNDHCIFCLDSDTHDGTHRGVEEVKRQILDGRRAGAERLILSGGEPTIHPRFVDFVRLGRLAGYAKVQTVTNGRMFQYPEFLERALDAGLDEITFSIHGPDAKVHDALVGTKGAFEQEVAGLRNALADGRPIVNIDVVVNRGNVRHLPAILETFVAMGVKEYDLLQVIPFGRAFTDGRDTLFYDLEEARPFLAEAFAWSRRPDMHIWLNRFPPEHCEGFEELIQDPKKLEDEVRGRRQEFGRLLERGEALPCRDPRRCHYCYLEPLCDTLEEVRATVADAAFDEVRVDTGSEARQGPTFGGDPASDRRAGRRRLAVVDDAPPPVSVEELARRAGARTLRVVGPDPSVIAPTLARFPGIERLALELDGYDGLEAALADAGVPLASAVARTPAVAERLLAMDASFEVVLWLTRASEPWLLALERAPARLAIRQPTWTRLTESAAHDVDVRAFFARFTLEVPVEGLPACVVGRAPRAPGRTLDTAMMTPDGRLEIFRYTRRFVAERYLTKSLRCRQCRFDPECRGVHVNHVRAHGYRVMEPVR